MMFGYKNFQKCHGNADAEASTYDGKVNTFFHNLSIKTKKK
jgi:hypothetical protein